jgi:hypothetical protein
MQQAFHWHSLALLLINAINPTDLYTYSNRAVLKYTNLNDRPGAIKDMRQSIKLARSQGNSQHIQRCLKVLQNWGVTE